MNIEEQLKRYRENQNIIPDEQHIKETVHDYCCNPFARSFRQ